MTHDDHVEAHDLSRTAGDVPVGPSAADRDGPDPLRAIFQRILREFTIAAAVIGVVGAVVGYLLDGTAGLIGALLGVGLALVFSGTTVLSMQFAVGKPPTVLAGVILGAWLAKIVVLIAVLAVLKDLTFYNKYVFATVLVAVVLASTVIDVRAVVKARIPIIG